MERLVERKIQKEASRFKIPKKQLVQAVSYLSYLHGGNRLEADIYRDMLPENFDFEPAENVIQFINEETDGEWE